MPGPEGNVRGREDLVKAATLKGGGSSPSRSAAY